MPFLIIGIFIFVAVIILAQIIWCISTCCNDTQETSYSPFVPSVPVPIALDTGAGTDISNVDCGGCDCSC